MSSEKSNNTSETIYLEHFQMMFGKLTKKLAFRAGTIWDAEDALMDAYERAWKYLATFDPEKNAFPMWMSRIISNAVKDHINKNKGIAEMEFDEEMADGYDCEFYSDKIHEEIVNYINAQRPQTAEILTLFYIYGYTAKDISHLVESTHMAVHQTINRFRTEIKERYKNGGSLSA